MVNIRSLLKSSNKINILSSVTKTNIFKRIRSLAENENYRGYQGLKEFSCWLLELIDVYTTSRGAELEAPEAGLFWLETPKTGLFCLECLLSIYTALN